MGANDAVRFEETLYSHRLQVFRIQQILHHELTAVQDLIIFESTIFGRVLALDGIIQTTETDEHHRREMMVHIPLLAYGRVRFVCVIGGGDRGILCEGLQAPKRGGYAGGNRYGCR